MRKLSGDCASHSKIEQHQVYHLPIFNRFYRTHKTCGSCQTSPVKWSYVKLSIDVTIKEFELDLVDVKGGHLVGD